jgi:large subunit ribosomal protein L9
MKIILQREVDKLGAPGDVVDVADGYARNYLIPRGMAAPAVKGAVRHADRLRKAHEERTRKAVAEAQALADRLTASSVRLAARAGEEGKLFGSITVGDVAEQLGKVAGVAIDRHDIRLTEPIRSLGTHEVVVHLHPELNATITVEVVRE